MTTALKKPVKRKTITTRRDRSKHRKIIITLYPAHGDAGEIIGFRLEGTQSVAVFSGSAWKRPALKNSKRKENIMLKSTIILIVALLPIALVIYMAGDGAKAFEACVAHHSVETCNHEFNN